MSSPIKFDPNDRIRSESNERSRKAPGAPNKFKEIIEDDPRKTVAQLKKHNKSLDANAEDLEEFGKVPEEEVVKDPSLFDLSSSKLAKEKAKKGMSGRSQEEKEREIALRENEPAKARLVRDQEVLNKQVQTKRNTAIRETTRNEGEMIARSDMISSQIMTQGASAAVINVKVEETQKSNTTIQEVIDQIVEHISQQELVGKTETIVSLNHPPLLAGSQVVLTSFETAKGEFNISFENLSQRAKAFLDSNHRLDDLKTNLAEKGYVTHMITTTTIAENRVSETAHAQEAFTRRDDQDRQEQQRRQQQQEDDEENT